MVKDGKKKDKKGKKGKNKAALSGTAAPEETTEAAPGDNPDLDQYEPDEIPDAAIASSGEAEPPDEPGGAEPEEDEPEPDAEDAGDPYGGNAAELLGPNGWPLVGAHEEMPDNIFVKHLLGRHRELLKGQTTLKEGAPLRPYRGAHMRVHNSKMFEEKHDHAEAQEPA